MSHNGPATSTGDVVVVVIAKAPIPGHAKTRLCPPACYEEAADIAAAALLDTLDTVRSLPAARPVVALSGELACASRHEDLSAALADVPVIDQGTGGLAERLAHSMARASGAYPGKAAVLIGMDTPQVTAGMLTGAAGTMAERDIDGVLGPADDGGWWLLGLREPGYEPALDALRGAPMSMPDTGEQTRRALKDTGLNLATAPELTDVDTMADAHTVATEVPGGRFAAAVGARQRSPDPDTP